MENGPDDPPLTVEPNPKTGRLELLLNTKTKLMEAARAICPPTEAVAVDFVFKFGLALVAMALLESMTQTPEWKTNEAGCREEIQKTATAVARVIVPLCLTLPNKLPKPMFA